jgi:hypothetical protein
VECQNCIDSFYCNYPKFRVNTNAMGSSTSNNNGFALLMVILLLALLSGVVMQSLISTRMHLRAGDIQYTRFILRAASMDAAWNALRIGMKAGSSASDSESFEHQLPSGIRTRTTLHGLERTALPSPLQRPDVPIFGQFFSVISRAESGTRTSAVRGLACRLPSGDIRLLAWAETF